MAGFSDSKGHFDRFEIAHFADQHHIGVLPKGGPKGGAERMCVGGYFTLIDNAIFMIVEKLDRVLDCQNVIVSIDVDLIDHRRESGGFSRTRWTGYENKATRLFAHVRN